MAEKQIGAENSSVVLQASATSTVAGAEVEITQSGCYRFYAEGTLDTTTRPSLYVQVKNASTAYVYEDANSGTTAVLSKAGTGIDVALCAGDEVYSQNTVSGGTYNYNTFLGRID